MHTIPLNTTITLPGTHGRADRRLTLWDTLELDGITYIAALPEGAEQGAPILLQQTTDEDGAVGYRRTYRKQEQALAQFRRRDKRFVQIGAVDKYEVRGRLQHCISAAFDAADWDSGAAGEQDLTAPVECVRQLYRAVDYAFDRYGDAVPPGCAAGMRYLVNVNEYSFHPAFLLTTLFVLLLAGAEIQLRYPGERWNYFDPDPVLDELVTISPTVQRVKIDPHAEREYLQWANWGGMVDRIVDLGDAANMYHRYLRYKRAFHAPATRYVWVDYTDNQNLQDDEQLQNYGDRCYACCYDYEAMYNARMTDLHSIETYVGMDYEPCTEEELHRELCLNADNPLFMDKVQLVVFTDKPEADFRLPDDLRSRVQLVRQQQLSDNDLLYDFMQLLKPEE